jgi:hypothetical protein
MNPLTPKEVPMQYKTIVLRLLTQHPEISRPLKKSRTLLPTMERLALGLKDRHQHWTEELARARPGSDPSQLASEALELALKELEDHLQTGSPPDEQEPPSLDGAMAFLHRPTPPE